MNGIICPIIRLVQNVVVTKGLSLKNLETAPKISSKSNKNEKTKNW